MMFRRVEAFFIASVLVLITGIILIIYTMEREQEFKKYNAHIQKVTVESAAYAINIQLKNKRRHVALFLDEYNRLFSQLDRFRELFLQSSSGHLRHLDSHRILQTGLDRVHLLLLTQMVCQS